MSRREEIIAAIGQVPKLPIAATQTTRILQDEEFNMNDLVRTIEHDQIIAANVLKMANSAYYAGPHSIGSIREAIVRLGSKSVYELVLAMAIAPLAKKEIAGYDLSPGELWEHSVTTAVATVEIAKIIGIKKSDTAFTAAILHDIGKIVLGAAIEVDPTPILMLAFESGISFEEAEKEILGINHAEVGALLLEQWKIPEEIVAVVRWHHQPDNFDGESMALDLVHVAFSLIIVGGIGAGVDGLNYKPSKKVMGRLDLSTTQLEEALNATMENLEELREFMGISN